MRKFVVLFMLLSLSLGVGAQTKRNTSSRAKTTKVSQVERKVLGKHMLALQWISWEDFGTCTITKNNRGQLICKGEQRSKKDGDYLKIDGTITIVNAKHLRFTGTISSLVSYLNNGREFKRKGTFNFVASGKRKYWRLQEMNRANDECVDYVDIFF